jgi:Galactose-3-O-sulfotransferase
MGRPIMALPKASFKTAACVAVLVLSGQMILFLKGRNGASQLPLSVKSSEQSSGFAGPEAASKNKKSSSNKKPLYLEVQFRDGELHVIEPRVYRSWPAEEPLPCYDEAMTAQKRQPKVNNYFRERENYRRGFLYMRPPKCASTTVGGVNMRIARNEWTRRMERQQKPQQQQHPPPHDANLNEEEGEDGSTGAMEALRRGPRSGGQYASQTHPPMCDLSFSHGGRKKGRRFVGRVRDESYLWTVIREPTARHVSFFWFWGVSANHKNTTDDAFQEFLWQQPPDYYFTFLSPRFNTTKWRIAETAEAATPSSTGRRPQNSTMTYRDQLDEVSYLMTEYDFIGITERLDESLVVLGMLLRLPMSDLLYYSAKASDNFYIDPETKNRCIVLQPSVVSPGMEDFFRGAAWKHRIYSDAVLYRAAQRSLDLTIDALGRDEVLARVEQLQSAQRLVVERCRGKVKMECEVEGYPPNREFDCFHHDMGCGMSCLDHVATELKLW